MKIFSKIFFAFVFILPCIFLCSCTKEKEFSLQGVWNGSTSIDVEISIECEEYETLEGEFLGKRDNSTYQNITLVNDEIKNLTLKSKGLVERTTRLYLGEEFTFSYVLKDVETKELLYTSEEVVFYETKACFDKETKEFIGEYTSYSYSNYHDTTTYVINGQEYSSNDVENIYDVYVSLETNLLVGKERDFLQEKTYYVGEKVYQHNEVYELEGMSSSAVHEDWFSGDSATAYVENATNYCYKVGEVESTYGYQYGEDKIAVPSKNVKKIIRKCVGDETTSAEIHIGENFAKIKLSVVTKYDYSHIEGYTFTRKDSASNVWFRGKFGILDNVVYFTAEEYSYNENDWSLLSNSNRKFEIEIKENQLHFSDKSVNLSSIYKEITLSKQEENK